MAKLCYKCYRKLKYERSYRIHQEIQAELAKVKDEAYSNNYFENLEIDQLLRLIAKTTVEREVYEELLDPDKYGTEYEKAKDDIQWYIQRMLFMEIEMRQILEEKQNRPLDSSKVDLFVQDHIYDIRDIHPYCDFLVDEDLLKRDTIYRKLLKFKS